MILAGDFDMCSLSYEAFAEHAFFAKNERTTNIFARIAGGEAEAILYHWVSNTFDTHII